MIFDITSYDVELPEPQRQAKTGLGEPLLGAV